MLVVIGNCCKYKLNLIFMKKLFAWRSFVMIFCMVMTVGLWSCNDEDVENSMPFIAVPENQDTLTLVKEGGESVLEILSNREWSIKVPAAAEEWLSVSPDKGENNGKVTILTTQNGGGARSAELTLSIGISSTKVLVVQEGESGAAGTEALYQENCGAEFEKEGQYWPYVDQYTGWEKGGSLDQSEVKYAGNKASVRVNFGQYNPSTEDFSSAPYVYMGKPDNYFVIEGINVNGKTNFTFMWAALFQESYDSKPVFAPVTNAIMTFFASVDGKSWSPVAFVSDNVAGWSKLSAEFKLPEGSKKLYVKFENKLGNDQQLRIDDFKLFEGGNGELIEGGSGQPEQPEDADGVVENYPKDAVTTFAEEFATAIKGKAFESNLWGFYSSDSEWKTDAKFGWKGNIFNDDKYIDCAPFSSALDEVVAYAIMAPFNVKDASAKILDFELAWYYKTADNTKLEIVASTDFAGNVNKATWKVLKDCSFASDAPMNKWVKHSIDLSKDYAGTSKVYIAFRYTGKSNTYRLDHVSFGGGDIALSFGTPSVSGAMTVGKEVNGVKISIPYFNAKGTEKYTVSATVAGVNGLNVAGGEKTLNAGNGTIELDVTGTPDAEGEATFTITGIDGLTDNTVTAMVKGESGEAVDYTSNVALPTVDDSGNSAYVAKVIIDGTEYDGLKLGTSKKIGTYIVENLPATGDATLSFYGVAWNGRAGVVKITVENGGTIDGEASKMFDLVANAGAKDNTPFTLTVSESDKYSAKLSGITASTILKIETLKDKNRAILFGVNVK